MDIKEDFVNPENTNFIARAFAAGGTPMYFIGAIGIMAVILIVERAMTLNSVSVNKKDFAEKLFRMVASGDIKLAISFCDARPAPLTNTVKSGLIQAMNKRPDEEIQVAMDASVLREMPRVEGWTSYLAVFGNIAVLTGLFGTVLGMIKSFKGVAAADPASKSIILSEGISEALNCTAFGLLIAIMSIIAYGLYQHKIQQIENEMIETSMSLLNLVAANRDKIQD